MEIDKLKRASTIKIFVFFAYLIYFATSNTNLNNHYEKNAYLKSDTELKRGLLSNKCLLLIGGSNVRMGLSAEDASIKSCEALNLGVSDEGGGFQKYLSWLNANTSANKVIYSSALIWQDSPLIGNGEDVGIKFPAISFFKFLEYIILNKLFNKNEDPPVKFNQFGDQVEYKCFNTFRSYSIRANVFTNSSHLINQEIYKRISILKKITNSDEILVRVPPIYVKKKSQAELYAKLMSNRIEMLKGLGVKIVGSTIVSTDGSLFCDSFHPNPKGREAFTKEIRMP